MLDLSRLTKLTEDLEQAVLSENIDEIQRLCSENSDFIFSIQPEKKNTSANQQLKSFIDIHQSATLLVKQTHQTVQNQLYQSIKARKSVSKYKGVKHAE
ncbi:hypothetical protein DFP75_104111 [Marinomonas alcarazii]|uniref:Flagellar protein FliT n=1 Tax=Marinomonas alcarazii TaxID=491949 RepID=A0A318V1Q0_9GAMM|nr:hypothetical protein [Marinomonas alcarazii]PYF81651.1 hypothetical protein DFP75_104111 [Marinomonas alcarazii]